MRTFSKYYLYIINFLLFVVANSNVLAQSLTTVERQTILMGTRFQITIVANDSTQANRLIDKTIEEISRIENLISEWMPHTEVSQVNSNAGIKPTIVSKEVFDLTKRAIYYSKLTDGAFDISIAAMDRIWRFDDTMDSLPSPDAITQSINKVGYQYIILDSVNSTIFLQKKGMKIGFGSIGKGYAADKGRELMKQNKVVAGIVDASGDIATWGTQPNHKPWLIGIRNPFHKNKIVKVYQLRNAAIATSGSYEKYAEIDNVRYSHIINPKTGFPSTGLTSVTISGPSTEFANALSTSIMVIGEHQGKKLIKQFPDYQYLIITDTGKITKTK